MTIASEEPTSLDDYHPITLKALFTVTSHEPRKVPSENALRGFQTLRIRLTQDAHHQILRLSGGWGPTGSLQFSPGASAACALGIAVLDPCFSAPTDLVKGQMLSPEV